MDEIATYQQSGLPDKIEDVAHFLLIAPEKATALRAEIRAINKVGLAKEVYDQKLEEQRRLCDMILDASVRLGEMTKEIPKATRGTGANQYKKAENDNTVHFSNGEIPKSERSRTDIKLVDSTAQQTKSEAIRDLGFSPKQVQRFETLADNRDLVELEKVKAREENRMPTRTNVIDMAQERKKRMAGDIDRIDTDGKYAKAFVHAVHAPLMIADNLDDVAGAVWRNADGNVSSDIEDIDAAIQALTTIKTKLLNGGKLYAHVKNYY